MNVLLYEFITGGGWHTANGPPPPTLMQEGAAMLGALARDFSRLPGVRLMLLRDARLPQAWAAPAAATVVDVQNASQERRQLTMLAQRADWTVVIAPEFDGHLLARVQWVAEGGGRLLSPGAAAVRLAADKHATAECLAAAGVPAPRGKVLAAVDKLPPDAGPQWVLKPRWGAGSQHVVRLSAANAGRRVNQVVPAASDAPHGPPGWRLEPFCPGRPVSVAVLCGPGVRQPLPACSQRLKGETFEYVGGELPLPPPLNQRAQALALLAVAILPAPVGYVGVDLVLAENAADDMVIEINPRLTTSYIGLSAAMPDNLAAGLLAAAGGETPRLAPPPGAWAFHAGGEVWRTDAAPGCATLGQRAEV